MKWPILSGINWELEAQMSAILAHVISALCAHHAQEMAALGLTEEAAERLVSSSPAQHHSQSASAAVAAPAAASSGNSHHAAADSQDAADGIRFATGEPAADDIHDDADIAEPSALDGLDALDPDYWHAAPTPALNGSRSDAGTNGPRPERVSEPQPAQPSPDQPSRPNAAWEQPTQRSAGVGDEDSDDGGGMGLFNEESGTEWDAPPPAAKPAARAASQRPTGKAKGPSGPLISILTKTLTPTTTLIATLIAGNYGARTVPGRASMWGCLIAQPD